MPPNVDFSRFSFQVPNTGSGRSAPDATPRAPTARTAPMNTAERLVFMTLLLPGVFVPPRAEGPVDCTKVPAEEKSTATDLVVESVRHVATSVTSPRT